MKRIWLPMFMDAVLIPAFWLSAQIRIQLFLVLAVVNIAYYLFLLTRFFLNLRNGERIGLLLEFVMIQSFLCAALFLFKLSDLMILYHSR